MAALLGLDDADVEAACTEAAQGGVVEAANFNSPGQVVIAGETAAVQRAIEAAKARGAKRAVLLPVSVPSHSSLMRGAGERLRERLSTVALQEPRIPYVSAVDGACHETPDDIRSLLVRQIASPVRWTATVQALVAAGSSTIVECGPGKVLTSLNKRIARGGEVHCFALEDPASVDATLAALHGGTHG